MFTNLFSRIKTWFISGLLVSLPVTLTVFIVYTIVDFFDSVIVKTLFPNNVLAQIPGIGFIFSIILIILIGLLASNFFGKYLLVIVWDKLFARIPFVKSIYSTLKQIFSTVLSANSKAFREVVLIEYPRKGLWIIGFVTCENKGEIQDLTNSEIVNVFVPTTPNPTSGFLVFVPKQDVYYLKMTPNQAMRLIISGGVVDTDDEELSQHIKR